MTKSAYIHVPFCKSICSYCDFTRWSYQDELARQWLLRICQDIHTEIKDSLDTIYIGGGTPNALSIEQLEVLLAALDPAAKNVKEYTMEANPELLNAECIAQCVRHGVNRISLGVQSFQKDLLQLMNRKHDARDIFEKVNLLHESGIHNISVDLMYGLPGQTVEKWKEDLQQAVQLPINHISLYSLTIEENSVFGRQGIQKADDELEYQMYAEAIAFLEKHGFHQYEIANFAKNNTCSMHNLTYWHYEDFYGIGCGASGKTEKGRYDNTRDLKHYLQYGADPSWTLLDAKEQMFETIMMGLRLKEGIDLCSFEKRYRVSLLEQFHDAIMKHIEKNLVVQEGHLKTTEEGKFILHDILIDFL